MHSFTQATTFWNKPNWIIEALYTVYAWKVSRALNWPVEFVIVSNIEVFSCKHLCIHRSLPCELGQPLSFLLSNQLVSIHVFWGICEEQCVTVNLAKEIQIIILQCAVIVPYYCTFIIRTMWPNFIGCINNTSLAIFL